MQLNFTIRSLKSIRLNDIILNTSPVHCNVDSVFQIRSLYEKTEYTMPSFQLSCESTVDLPYSYIHGRDIPVLFYNYTVDGTQYR